MVKVKSETYGIALRFASVSHGSDQIDPYAHTDGFPDEMHSFTTPTLLRYFSPSLLLYIY